MSSDHVKDALLHIKDFIPKALHLVRDNLLISSSALLCVILLYIRIQTRLERSRIGRLGTFAPSVTSYLPYGIDIALRNFTYSRKHQDLDFWTWLFAHSPHRNSPTVETYMGWQRFIFTAEPENIKAILATQFEDYGKGPVFHEDFKDFLGDGIFNTDGENWQFNRHLIRPQFIKERVQDLDTFETHVQKVIAKLGGQGLEVDVAALFYRYTLDSATDYLLGQSVGCLDDSRVDFAKDFNEIQRVQTMIARVGPLNTFIPRWSFWRALKTVDGFVQPYIDQALRMNIQDLKQMSNQSFLQAVAATGTRDRKVIRDQVVNILLAGRDTTAGTLSFLFLELSRHPEKYAKLRKEILDKVGPTARPTYQDLKNMPYLKNTMNETLRIYPSVPFNIRVSWHDTTLPTGGGHDGKQPIGVLGNTAIGYSPLAMQQRLDLYPDSTDFAHPHEFSPERWETWTPKAWQYLPFNGGPRICLGQQFALTEMGYTITRIMQRFERIDCHSPITYPQYKCEVVMSPVDGVKVGFWDAKA